MILAQPAIEDLLALAAGLHDHPLRQIVNAPFAAVGEHDALDPEALVGEPALDGDRIVAVAVRQQQIVAHMLQLDVFRADARAEAQLVAIGRIRVRRVALVLGVVGNGVETIAQIEQIDVLVRAADQGVVALAAGQHIIAAAGVEQIVARSAFQGVVAGVAVEHVVAGAALQQVIAVIAVQGVVAGAALEHIVLRAAFQHAAQVAARYACRHNLFPYQYLFVSSRTTIYCLLLLFPVPPPKNLFKVCCASAIPR